MLFMGSKKYPNEKIYSEFIEQHSGVNNAWTSGCNTNYYFTIDKKYLEKTLDMLAQFFISPIFDQNALEREMKAVNSEFEMGVN